MKLAIITAAVCATFGTCALASDDTVQAPEAGSYAANIYIQNADYGCIDSSGYSYLGEVSFAGLSGTTHYLRVPLANGSYTVASVERKRQVFSDRNENQYAHLRAAN
jgi:hypothetical protein